jgi:molybdopterin/thiamine biosynthesis adenylyltransferase/rhodanese-related sulfurtransferase
VIIPIDPSLAHAKAMAGLRLIDVREAHETALGYATGAELIPQNLLLASLANSPRDQSIALICQGGVRSQASAAVLESAGFHQIYSVVGGSLAWQAAGLPWQQASGFSSEELQRYARQLLLPELGIAGQTKLRDARVLLVGAGGLGSPCALYLAAAGVGQLKLADGDQVDLSNLHRQVLHSTESVGQDKTASASARLQALNPHVRVTALPQLGADTIDAAMANCDLVIDGSDNFPTRFLIADACVKNRLPLVYGAVLRFDGQVSVFKGSSDRSGESPCYRCLFPHPPPPEFAPSCAEAGVLGVLPGIIGSLQALEAIKLITGIGRSLNGSLLTFSGHDSQFRQIRIPRDPNCPACAPGVVIHYPSSETNNIDAYCATSFNTSS